MTAAHVRARARSLLRTTICAAVSLTAAWLIAAAVPASADCVDGGGTTCTAGIGYVDDVNWSCSINTADCYYNASVADDWGWLEATYSGAGSVYVCGRGDGGTRFIGCGYNLARICAIPSCDDQDLYLVLVRVQNQSGVTHTINGRAKG